MLRQIQGKLALAALVTLCLTDLQLYAHHYRRPSENLGLYLRRHIEIMDCMQFVKLGCSDTLSRANNKAPPINTDSNRLYRS